MTDGRGGNISIAQRARLGLIALIFAGGAVGTPLSQADAQATGDGFLFRRSYGQLLVHGGFANARTRSSIFDFTTENLTLERGDFSAFEGGLELSAAVNSRLAITLGFDYANSTHRSEFRDWVDNDNLPIEQTTSFTRMPIMLGMKGYIIPTGQSVGLLAWVPSRFAPFVAGGIGLIRYSFEQQGDWVDFEDFSVFSDEFTSGSTALMSYVGAGMDVSLNTRFGITTEVRRMWARGEHTNDFIGFDNIDLSGTTIKAGFFVRF